MAWTIFAVLIATGLGWLAVVVVRCNLELRAVRSVATALGDSQRDQIFELIEQIGTGPSRGFLGLLKHAQEPSGRLTLQLPSGLADFPWGGMTVEVRAAPRKSETPVDFRVHDQPVDSLLVRWLAVPSIEVGQKGRLQNVYSLDRYIGLSPALGERLRELYPKNPKLLLSQILSVDRRHDSSEPFDQLRCGLPAAWIQTPRFHKCPECRRPMRLILQVPGSLVAWRIAEGCFYLLGCQSHVDQTITEYDWG